MGFISDLLGGAPSVSSAVPKTLNEAKDKAARARASLFETKGGVTGEEVEDVKKKNSLLGN